MTNQSNKHHYRVSLRDGNNAIEPLTIEQVIIYISNLNKFGIAYAFIVTDCDTDEVVMDIAETLQ